MDSIGPRHRHPIGEQQKSLSPSEARKIVKHLPSVPLEVSVAPKNISERRTTTHGRIFGYLNRYVLKPLNLFQGSISAMTLSGVQPSEETVEAEARELWQQFNNPTSAYVLTYPNTKGPFKGSQHSGVVIGSTEDKDMKNVGSYASWGYDPDDMTCAAELATHYKLQTFIEDYKLHGRPEIVEIKNLNTEGMLSKWEWMKNNHRFYSVIALNCSKVGFRLVRHGLGLDERRVAGEVRPKGFWTPYDLENWAKDMQQKRDQAGGTLS